MRAHALVFTTLLLLLVGGETKAAAAEEPAAPGGRRTISVKAPAFRRYPAPPVFRGRHAKPKLTTSFAKSMGTRLRWAARGKPNYAGIHGLALWGCGTNCMNGAAVN